MVLRKENVIVPFLNLLLSGFSTLRSLFTARAVRVRFLVDKILFTYFGIMLSVIPSTLQFHYYTMPLFHTYPKIKYDGNNTDWRWLGGNSEPSVVGIATVRGSNPGSARVSAPRNILLLRWLAPHLANSLLITHRRFIISVNRQEIRTTCLYIYTDMRICVCDMYCAYSIFCPLVNKRR